MKTLNILLNITESYIPKVEYVFKTFCRLYNIDYKFHLQSSDDIDVYYGEPPYTCPVTIYHNPDASAFFSSNSIYRIENVDFAEYHGVRLPFLFSNQMAEASINKDIISSAFYFLSCWQEIYDPVPSKDKYNRYEHSHSLQCQGGFTEIPVVDYYFKMLADSLEILPKNKFNLYLSHDIDYYNYWSKDYLNLMYKKNIKRLFRQPLKALYKIIGYYISKKDRYNPAEEIKKLIKMENTYGFTSTFNLMAQGCSDDPRQHYFQDSLIVDDLKRLLENNWIGLHGTISASQDELEMRRQWDTLSDKGFKPSSYRNHFLCFDYNSTYTMLEKYNIKIDTTLGYHEYIGFRAGISTPFYPYDLNTDREFRVLEIPLAIMDTTLYAASKMNLSYKVAKRRCISLIDITKKANGQVSLLWHNNSFDKIEYRWLGKLYWELVKYCLNKAQ